MGNFCVTQVTKMFYSSLYFSAVLAKGEMELERKETIEKVQEDRKDGYPYRPVHFKHTRQDCYTLCLCRLGDKDVSFFRAFSHVINQGFSLRFLWP